MRSSMPAITNWLAPRVSTRWLLRSTVQPSEAMYPVHSAAPEKYSWLPVMNTRAFRAVASRSGSTWWARAASEPSTRSPVCASTSTSRAFTWATIRRIQCRDRNGPRWVSASCPMRSPSSPAPSPSMPISRSRTGTGPSARYAPQASSNKVQPNTTTATTRALVGSGTPANASPSRTSSPAADQTNSCQITPSQRSPAATAHRIPRPWPSSSAAGSPAASTAKSTPSAVLTPAGHPGCTARLVHGRACSSTEIANGTTTSAQRRRRRAAGGAGATSVMDP